jgi:hypothetical protein
MITVSDLLVQRYQTLNLCVADVLQRCNPHDIVEF